jgi:hypothetical protein
LRTDVCILAALSIGALIPGAFPRAARAAEAESLLLPGIDLRAVEFTVGAWCRYLVVDEAMGETDSSTVYLAIVGRETTRAGTAYWLEIESGPARAPDTEREAIRALVDERVKSMAPGDSLYRYLERLYIRKGRGPVEAGNPRDLNRLTIVTPTAESDWQIESGHLLSTPAGELTCELRSFAKEESRDIPTGRVTLRQHREDRVQVWISPVIPIFHLAQCKIDRVRESRTVPPVRGIPDAGPKRSRTTSVVVAHGTGAKPLVSIP